MSRTTTPSDPVPSVEHRDSRLTSWAVSLTLSALVVTAVFPPVGGAAAVVAVALGVTALRQRQQHHDLLLVSCLALACACAALAGAWWAAS